MDPPPSRGEFKRNLYPPTASGRTPTHRPPPKAPRFPWSGEGARRGAPAVCPADAIQRELEEMGIRVNDRRRIWVDRAVPWEQAAPRGGGDRLMTTAEFPTMKIRSCHFNTTIFHIITHLFNVLKYVLGLLTAVPSPRQGYSAYSAGL